MERAFVYGMSVEGVNFTDRVKETKRLKLDFENGINVILISPRRMGKSSIVKKVKSEITNPEIKVVYMDVYDCRSEYDFYNRFATVLMKETASKSEQIIENIKRFLVRLTPKISFSPEPTSDFSLSLGITPQNYQPEEILQLPELIAQEQDKCHSPEASSQRMAASAARFILFVWKQETLNDQTVPKQENAILSVW